MAPFTCGFHTVAIEVDSLSLDLASARRETYPSPAANPVVEQGSLEVDLTRRDFSINAMALVLRNIPTLSPWILTGGADHLLNSELVFLHSESVKDDPTRVVERLVTHLALISLREDARQQVLTTVREWPWGWRTGDEPSAAPPALSTRMRMELELLLEKEPWPQALQNLGDWGAYPLLDVSLQDDPLRNRRLLWSQRLGLPLLPALLLGADNPQALAQRLQLPLLQQRWLMQVEELLKWLDSSSSEAPQSFWSPVDWTIALEGQKDGVLSQ